VRRISRNRPADENHFLAPKPPKDGFRFQALSKEAEKNPELKNRLENLAMQYLTDSQLIRTVQSSQKIIDSLLIDLENR